MKTMSMKKVVMGLASLLLMASTVACNNGGGGGGSAAIAPGYAAVGGIANPTPVPGLNPNVYSVTPYQDFYFNVAVLTQAGSSSSYMPVALQGSLTITDGLYCLYPGTYTITTAQAGTMNGSSISSMYLIATSTSGQQIPLTLNYAVIENAGRMTMNTTIPSCPPNVLSL